MRNLLTLLTLAILAPLALGQGERFGSLKSTDKVFTPDTEIVAPGISVKDGFPVFVIAVTPPYTEVQLRASITNFEPGFLLKAGGVPIYNFIPLIDEPKIASKWQYRALGTTDLKAVWDIGDNRWEIVINGTTISYYGALPWALPAGDSNSGLADWSNAAGVDYTVTYEPFVYHTCTTGKAAEPVTWGTGSGDPDPWVFFAKQDTDPANFADHFKRQKWNWNTSLSSQISTVGVGVWSLGATVVYQPSRGASYQEGDPPGCLGADEWMQQNLDRLTWVYQLQMANGDVQLQPNGTPVWHITHPAEWRKNRIELPIP